MSSRRARHVVASLLVAPLAVALAACSSSSTKAATPGPRTTSTTAAATTTTTSPGDEVTRSAGCSKRSVAAPGETTVHVTSSGVDRWYIRHVPPSYAATKPTPLIVDIHGYLEGAKVHAVMSQLGAFGDKHGFVTITPNGLGKVPQWQTALGSNDLKFIGDALDDAEASLCVDTTRVYAAGLSQGAFMSSAIACEYADRFAAVAPVAGITANIKDCKPARPVAVVAFHGTADGIVSYSGGLGEGALNLPAPDGSGRRLRDLPQVRNRPKSPSVPQQLEAWAKRNGCTLKLQQKKVTSDVTLLSYPCPKGADVELYRVTGGGHSWPGSAFSANPVVAQVTGKTTMTINADALIWAFFQQHHL